MLEIKHLSYSYKETKALENIHLSVVPGTICALYGHNGCGKSTLLKIISGSLMNQAGSISFDGQSMVDKKGQVTSTFRYVSGYLSQGTSSDDKLSLQDNLRFFGGLYGLSKKELPAKINECLTAANLSNRAHDKVKMLSGGMRRRLELYRTFMHEPKIVLLDEASTGLDDLERGRLMNFLQAYKTKHNAVIILSTHHADELENADRVIMMKQGAILLDQAPSLLKNDLGYFNIRASFANQRKIEKTLRATDLSTQLESSGFLNDELIDLHLSKANLADTYNNLDPQGR